jgi:hypothetical protein
VDSSRKQLAQRGMNNLQIERTMYKKDQQNDNGYTVPQFEIVEFQIESGFALSSLEDPTENDVIEW